MKTIVVAIVCGVLCFSMNAGAVDDIQDLAERLKSCDDEACREALQNEAEVIFDASGKHFEDDFMEMGVRISVSYCQSILKEMFYHMEKLKSYHNFDNKFRLDKLKKLRKNRDKFDGGGIGKSDFHRINNQIETQYQQDLGASRSFIEEKVFRLKELCDNLRQQTESVKASLRIQQREMPQSYKDDLLSLKENPTWRNFAGRSKEGKMIRETIEYAAEDAGAGVIACIRGAFSAFETEKDGKIFSPEMLEQMR